MGEGEAPRACRSVPADLEISPFEPEDLPALQRVRAAAFEPVFCSFRDIVGEEIAAIAFAQAEAEQGRLLDDICAPGARDKVLVVTRGGAIVGFIAFKIDMATRIGEIGLNAVAPGHAGKGIGSWMYDHVLARMRENGMALATVSTGADPSHAPARRAYEKAGFVSAIPSITLYGRL